MSTLSGLAVTAVLYALILLVVHAAARLALSRPPQFLTRARPPRLPWWAAALAAGAGLALLFTVMLHLETRLAGSAAATAGAGRGGRGPLTLFITFVAVINAVALAGAATRTTRGRVAASVLLLAVVAAWVADPGWLTMDLVAVMLAVQFTAGTPFRSPFATQAAAGLILAAGFDAVQVLLTHSMTGLANVTVSQWVPLMILVPSAPLHILSGVASAVGVADLFIPGILIVAAGRLGQRTGHPGFCQAAFGGYAAGAAAGLVVTLLVPSAILPFTVFTVPAVTAAVLAAAWRTGTWAELTCPAGAAPAPSGEAAGGGS